MKKKIRAKVIFLQKRYGSLRSTAKAIGISNAQLSKLKNGEQDNPHLDILIKLGFKLT